MVEVGFNVLIPVLVDGLLLGALYCLISMGLTLIWGTLDIFNFAHGAFTAIGAYVTWTVLVSLGLSYVVAVAIALISGFVLGIVLERVAMFPILKQGLMPIILSTFAVSIFIENGLLVVYGPKEKRLPLIWDATFRYYSVAVTGNELLIFVTAIVVLTAMGIFLRKTRMGLTMLAVSQDKEAANLLGIKVPTVYAATVGLATSLAVLAGIFLGAKGLMTPTMGGFPLMKAFVIIILGGLGSIRGTVLASFIVAEIEVLASLLIGAYWSNPTLFLVMMAILIVRPYGMFKEKGG